MAENDGGTGQNPLNLTLANGTSDTIFLDIRGML